MNVVGYTPAKFVPAESRSSPGRQILVQKPASVLLEMKPCKRTISFSATHDDRIDYYYVPFPYTYFLVKARVAEDKNYYLIETYVFFSEKSATLIENYVQLESTPIYFGNSLSDGQLCMGGIIKKSTLKEMLIEFSNEFFSRPFTSTYIRTAKKSHGMSSTHFQEWSTGHFQWQFDTFPHEFQFDHVNLGPLSEIITFPELNK